MTKDTYHWYTKQITPKKLKDIFGQYWNNLMKNCLVRQSYKANSLLFFYPLKFFNFFKTVFLAANLCHHWRSYFLLNALLKPLIIYKTMLRTIFPSAAVSWWCWSYLGLNDQILGLLFLNVRICIHNILYC